MVVWGGKEVSAYPTSPGRLKLREATSDRSGCRRGSRPEEMFLTQMGRVASEEFEGSFLLTDGALAVWGASEEVEVLNVKKVRT